jgi:hypothetical protein
MAAVNIHNGEEYLIQSASMVMAAAQAKEILSIFPASPLKTEETL